MRLCSDTGKLRRQRLWDGGAVAGVVLGGLLLVHALWPMQTWTRHGFWALWLVLMAAGGYVAMKPRRDGRYACLDDEGVSVQAGWRTQRLAWSQVRSVSRHEFAMGAYLLEFEGPQGRLRVNLTAFADELAVFALVRRHLPWADSDHWTTRPSFRLDH